MKFENTDFENVVSVFVRFFKKSLPNLSAMYNWRIPAFDGFSGVPLSGYDANVRLKHYLADYWTKSERPQQIELAHFVVAKWGGVRANNSCTIERYVDEANSVAPDLPLKGIASYSKIFAIANPKIYAIYDARVAACLNAVQLEAGVRGIAFRYVSGRNLVVGHAGKRLGFVYQTPFTLKALIAAGWFAIPAEKNYQIYLELLAQCSKSLGDVPIYQLEMVLFSFAEQQCLQMIEQYAMTSS